MSSESVSSDMAQKQVEFDLREGKLVVKGADASVFSVDCSQPKLNLKQLYEAVFSDITKPPSMLVTSSNSVDGDEHARVHFNSIKKIIDDAQAEINKKLPIVLEERDRIIKSIDESMAGSTAANTEAF